MKSLSVSKARETLADVLGDLDQGPVEITRHGVSVGYIVSPMMFDTRENKAVIHRFRTPGVEPATKSIADLLAIELPPVSDEGPTLSATLEEMREERL